MTDRNPAEIMYPNHQSDPTSGSWHIELRYLPIAHRGHAFLALVDDRRPDGKAEPGPRSNGRISKIAIVASGSRDQIEKTWARGMRTGAAINAEKFDYKAHDPAYEFGGAAGLCGCGLCPKPDGFTVASASDYHERTVAGPDGNTILKHMRAFDAWVDNPTVAAFLREVVQQEGKSALVSGYGFQCRAVTTPDCPDCSSCARTMPRIRNNFYGFVGCVNDGVMWFQVSVGPGANVRAMTYWRR
jgi:hypothetical protein